jgi:hypothetical protein
LVLVNTRTSSRARDIRGPKGRRVGDTEHRRVRADAERQRQGSNQRESRMLKQTAPGIVHVLSQIVDQSETQSLSRLFFDQRQTAHRAQRRRAGCLDAHPHRDVLVNLSLEMKRKLRVELVLDTGPPEERSDSEHQLVQPAHTVSLCGPHDQVDRV